MTGVKRYYVYQLRSSACQHKCYIGITNNPRKRFKSHMGAANLKWRELTKCGRAVKRYGPHTFTMRILDSFRTPEEAMEAETKWILRFGRKKLWNSTYNSGGSYTGKSQRKRRKHKMRKPNETGREN